LKAEERIANVPLWSRLLLEWFGEALPTALTNSVLTCNQNSTLTSSNLLIS
jgi:hypothetical protein